MNADLAKKLRWKSGMNVLLLNPPGGFSGELMPSDDEGVFTIWEKPQQPLCDIQYDFALLFVSSAQELSEWASSLLSSLAYDGLLWIAYPKKSSKIKTDISRDQGWDSITSVGMEGIALVSINETWSSMRFRPVELVPSPRSQRTAETMEAKPATETIKDRTVIIPEDLQMELDKHPEEKAFFEALAYTHRKEYVRWITDAKRPETRMNRLAATIEYLSEGIKNPSSKKK
ncbi:YdeI/OmpD-associated family protein [Brevibacillus reuszeri]|uniref:YdeI/OmpD-associated family protein n=1 Tax=Brevibacillus reuszeri TaxID=54915 RepID=UPI0028980402|nr:YdeI/OmpD-associated family protein [Brevibacillus reuszeri]